MVPVSIYTENKDDPRINPRPETERSHPFGTISAGMAVLLAQHQTINHTIIQVPTESGVLGAFTSE